MSYAEVLLDLPLLHTLQYRLTPEQQQYARPGMRCVAPVGPRRLLLGVIADISSRAAIDEKRVRPLQAVLDDPVLPRDWLRFCEFVAGYYHHPWAQVVLGALPPALRRVPGARAASQLQRLRRDPPRSARATGEDAPPLRDEQRAAIEAIAGVRGFSPFLLHGVTGSGKTEVYLGAIAAALEADPAGQALWLVPEINLTPQFEARLQRRFAHLQVVSLHSGLGSATRTAAWFAAHEGRARIVLGTRLAVFASLPRLRMVIVDEEHDASFKASDGVRYCARDLAVKRAQLEHAPVVLGSATPSLESWHQAVRGRYQVLRLIRRPGQVPRDHPSPTPAGEEAGIFSPRPPQAGEGSGVRATRVQMIDVREHPPQQGLSGPLRAALDDVLTRREQALVFINRRGYAPVLACEACGWLSECPNCSAHSALHRAAGAARATLHCHHCGWSRPAPRACPTCGNQDLKPVGQGTQRVEETLRQNWPTARIGRLDRDSMQGAAGAQETLQRVHRGDLDLLVGTQMIAKGHDFQGVSLVCVLNADAQLVAADFRAPERLFALLMQVAGRAGRAGQAGRVLVQTRFPTHPLYEMLARGDYPAFAEEQLAERRAAHMPPFTHQALLAASARTSADVLSFLEQCRNAGLALAQTHGVTLYDTVPMPLARLASESRGQVLVESARRAPLHLFLSEWLAQVATLKAPRHLHWSIDVDPISV